jgi:hypothetical protein
MLARAQVSALCNTGMDADRDSGEIVYPGVFAEQGMLANV